MYRSIISAIFIFVMMSGCASNNYKAVAKLHDINQENIKVLKLQMVFGNSEEDKKTYEAITDADEKLKYFREKAKVKGAELNKDLSALEDRISAKYERKDAALQDGNTKNLKRAELEKEYYKETDALYKRSNDIVALYIKLTEAIDVLHRNGDDISKYLGQSPLKRLMTDVNGMDKEKLKQVGDDLKVIQQRIN